MERQAAQAVVNACTHLQPAEIRYAQAIEPATFRQCFSSYPFVDDQLMPIMQRVLAFALAFPGCGPLRISSELRRPKWGGLQLSLPTGCGGSCARTACRPEPSAWAW
jgi:hypothetical protein